MLRKKEVDQTETAIGRVCVTKAPVITKLFSGLIFLLILASPANAADPSLSVEIGDVQNAEKNYQLTKLAKRLNHPSAIAFLPDGTILVAERNAGLTLISGNQKIAVWGMPEIYAKSQAGLHDVALHPDFATNQLIYFSYSFGESKANATRLARARLIYSTTDRSARLEDLEVLFTRQPMSATSAHYGGRILFLPDGTLLLTVGEGYRYRDDAQKLDNHFGKVVRLNDDGSVPSDNPFIGKRNAKPEIYSYGHRNPQGLILTSNGDVLLHEHGPRGGDEVNLLQAGKNYGWPAITYGVEYTGAIISPFSAKEGMEQSIVHYVPSIAPSGFTEYGGALFPQWQGDLFIGGLVSRHVRRIDIQPDGSFGQQEKLFSELNSRIRDVRTGPDGALYFVTDADNGSLYRVTPD